MRKTVLNALKALVQAYSVLTVNKPLQLAMMLVCSRILVLSQELGAGTG